MEPEGSLPYSQEPFSHPVLSQMNPFHTFPPYFPKVYFYIIFLSVPKFSEWSIPFRIF
jgi:hypothetical protein